MYRLLLTALAAITLSMQTIGQTIALPPRTVEGRLANGLHYLILPNELPRHTVEVRLVMSVGSLQETDDQRGGAHFLEHMASAGMTNFPGNAMVDYFERQGMKYGRDINAFTGFDRTVYWYTLPIDRDTQDIIDSTLTIVRGVLTGLTLDEKRIRSERGVIVEELRGYDTHDPFYTLKIGDNRYSRRMPLGDESDITGMDRRRLTDFYQRWYAPCMATLIFVGDVDAAKLEQQLTSTLGTIPARAVSKPYWPVDYHKGVTLMERVDSIDNRSRLELIIPHKTIVPSTIAQTAEKYRVDMLMQALMARFNCRHMDCMATNQWYLADLDHCALTFSAPGKDSLLRCVRMAAEEMKQIARHGLTQSEIDYFAGERIRRLKLNREQTFSAEWCDQLIDYTLAGDRRIHTQTELDAVKQLLRQTTPRQMKQLTSRLLHCLEQHLLVAYTNHCGPAQQLTADEVSRAWKTASAKDALAQWTVPEAVKEQQVAVPNVLAASHPALNDKVVSRRYYDDLGLTEVKLRNGLTLLLRPTMDDDHRLQLSALGRGGVADIEDDDEYYLLKDAAGYVDMGGIEGIAPDTLSGVMGQHQISMNIGIEDHWHELMATGNSDDAQLMMNIVFEKMHHPRPAYDDFEEVRRDELDAWGQETLLGRLMSRDPGRRMQNRLDSLVGNVDRERRPMLKSDLEKLTIDAMTDYYRHLFTDPQDLTIILTGNYDLQQVEQAAVSTFGRMLRPSTPLNVSDECVQPVREHTEMFAGDTPSQTTFNYIFAGNYNPSLRTTLTFKLMRDLLQQRLLSVLRKQMNIVYSPYSDLYYHGLPQRTYYFWLTIAVKNENSLQAQQAISRIISDLQQHPVSERELQKLKRSFIVTKRQQLNDTAPAEWKTVLCGLTRNSELLEDYDRYADILHDITPEEVRRAFVNYIDNEHYLLMYQTKEEQKEEN